MRRLVACLGATLLVGLAAPSAALACNGWSEDDMQTQLMCVTCRVPIDQSESRFAQHVRSYLHQKCVAGWTGAQVTDTLIRQFGEEILAAPPRRGFDLLAWLVPAAVLLAGVGLAAALAVRWSRSRPGPPRPPPGGDLDAALAARIDADMAGLE